jgi:glycosyltransferase involved in cell wall biosynthesis
MKPLINILMRTHERPRLFARAVNSIKTQTYPHWNLIISADTSETEKYVRRAGYVPVVVSRDPDPAVEFPAQLYMPDLMDQVKDGWIIVVDDDDYFLKTNALEDIAEKLINPDALYCWHMRSPEGEIVPGEEFYGTITKLHIDVTCFAVHSSHKSDSSWIPVYTGDYEYIKGLESSLKKVEWIDNVYVQKGFRANGAEESILLVTDRVPIDFGGTVDVVFPLGKGSTWQNNELRYSIRSFVKNFTDLRHIVIIGQHPSFLDGVLHISSEDDYTIAKDERMLHKLLAACRDFWVTDTFIFASDDIFLLQPVGKKELCGWHFGDIPSLPLSAKPWEASCIRTRTFLESNGFKFKNFDQAHAPQPMNKEKILKWCTGVDPTGKTVSSLVLNCLKVKGKDARPFHELIREPLSTEGIQKRLAGKISFNINDEALNTEMKLFMDNTFPDPTRAERFDISGNAAKDYQRYLDTDRPYWYGVELIEQYSRNRILLRFLKTRGETTLTRRKLEMNLEIIGRKWKK